MIYTHKYIDNKQIPIGNCLRLMMEDNSTEDSDSSCCLLSLVRGWNHLT